MLIDEPEVLDTDSIEARIATVLHGLGGDKLATGCYEINHFGGSDFLHSKYNQRPRDLSVGSYGVCDDLANLLNKCPALEADLARQFVVTLTKITKAEQPARGGWRWHKWGEYIGAETPTTEYLHDEPLIDTVCCYHIYEKIQ